MSTTPTSDISNSDTYEVIARRPGVVIVRAIDPWDRYTDAAKQRMMDGGPATPEMVAALAANVARRQVGFPRMTVSS